jgi:hypothetical protein
MLKCSSTVAGTFSLFVGPVCAESNSLCTAEMSNRTAKQIQGTAEVYLLVCACMWVHAFLLSHCSRQVTVSVIMWVNCYFKINLLCKAENSVLKICAQLMAVLSVSSDCEGSFAVSSIWPLSLGWDTPLWYVIKRDHWSQSNSKWFSALWNWDLNYCYITTC